MEGFDLTPETNELLKGVSRAEMDELAVPPDLLAAHGAVSEPVAAAMATGAQRGSRATYALSITGIEARLSGPRRHELGQLLLREAHALAGQVTGTMRTR